MRCKIAVWREANKSIRQTQRSFNMEFGINLVPKRRTIYAIYRKFMKTGSVVSGVSRVPCTLGQEVFLLPRQQKLRSLK